MSHVSRRRFVINLTTIATGAVLTAACGELTATPAPTTVASKPVTTGAAAAVTAASKDGWSYEGATGVEAWGTLKAEYAVCQAGKAQSPINIPDSSKTLTDGIKPHYESTPIKVLNKGYTVEVEYEKGSYLEINGKRFDLVQFHFHTPSEHKIGDKGTAMELHLVHKSAEGVLAVLGVMMQEGVENSLLAKFWDKIPARQSEAEVEGKLNIGDILPPVASGYYTYGGSLTTPPCSEGVLWHVMKQPISLSKGQLDKYVATIGKDARPVQPLNDRPVSAGK